MTAIKTDAILPLLDRRRAHMSACEGRHVSTYGLPILGQEICFTADPENIQAACATQAKDFAAGEPRKKLGGQLSGRNIVSLSAGVIVCSAWV